MIIKRQKVFGFFNNLLFGSKREIWTEFENIPLKDYKRFQKLESQLPDYVCVWNENKINSELNIIREDLIKQGAVPVVSFCKDEKVNIFTIWYDPKSDIWVCRDSNSKFGWKSGRLNTILNTILNQMKKFGWKNQAEEIEKYL